MSILESIAKAVVNCDEVETPKLTQQAIAQGIPAKQILNDGLLKGMSEVGRLFRDGEYFVPEVLIAAEAMKASTLILKPYLLAQGVKPEATAVIGTVKGDLHDIGKNLVATMFEGAGFEVIDLGVDVTPEKFVAACKERTCHIVALSALLTTTMPMMEATVKALKAGLPNPPAIIIGGAPVTEEFAKKIGATAYGRDAATGAEVAKALCMKKAS
jgi:5-methyltetrahydrofolate--homocysteine methyltransferase